MVGRERAVPQAVAAGAAGTETLGMDPRERLHSHFLAEQLAGLHIFI
jgi:hypothetical protein